MISKGWFGHYKRKDDDRTIVKLSQVEPHSSPDGYEPVDAHKHKFGFWAISGPIGEYYAVIGPYPTAEKAEKAGVFIGA